MSATPNGCAVENYYSANEGDIGGGYSYDLPENEKSNASYLEEYDHMAGYQYASWDEKPNRTEDLYADAYKPSYISNPAFEDNAWDGQAHSVSSGSPEDTGFVGGFAPPRRQTGGNVDDRIKYGVTHPANRTYEEGLNEEVWRPVINNSVYEDDEVTPHPSNIYGFRPRKDGRDRYGTYNADEYPPPPYEIRNQMYSENGDEARQAWNEISERKAYPWAIRGQDNSAGRDYATVVRENIWKEGSGYGDSGYIQSLGFENLSVDEDSSRRHGRQ